MKCLVAVMTMNNESMAKRIGRKAALRRLAAKRGWDDGHEGREGHAPTKGVMLPFANGFGENQVPRDEDRAYWDGYDEGRNAKQDATNPHAAPSSMSKPPGR